MPASGHSLAFSYPQLPTGAADRLYRFAAEWTFFSLALPYLLGRFEDHMLLGFCTGRSVMPRFTYRMFPHAVFRGLERIDPRGEWGRTLWAVDNASWPDLERYLLSIVLRDTPRRTLYRLATQPLAVADPLWLERHRVLSPDTPLLPVTVFGVNASSFRAAFAPSPCPLLRLWEADPEIARVAKALFADDNPADVLDTKENQT